MRQNKAGWWVGCASVAAVLLWTALPGLAQVPNLTDTTSTPVVGVGHSFLTAKLPSDGDVFGGTVSEIVNPASGSVSWRICATVPKGRQLSVPFCFDYDSAGVHHLESFTPGNLSWASDTSYLEQGGWAYSLPELSEAKRQDVSGSYQCDYATDYMFQGEDGQQHAMHLAITGPAPGAPSNSCSQTSPTRTTVTTAGEGPLLATTTAPSGAFSVSAATVTDADGTQYVFNHPDHEAGANGFSSSLPNLIEDRNGNEIAVTDSGSGAVSLTDTVGRTLLATSGFGSSGDTVQVSGESDPYTLSWGTATTDYTVSANVESGTCSVPTTVSGSQPVVTAIELPDGSSFQFEYDPTYGLLKEIIFPTGGYIRYTWGLNAQAEEGTFDAGSGSTCNVRYDQPVVTGRYLSLDGKTEILNQGFAYATTWDTDPDWASKQTTLTNSDQARGTSFATDYTYSALGVVAQPDDDTASSLQLPVEQTIAYKDWNGATLRTLNQTWNNPRELATTETTESDGSTNEQAFSYDGSEQQTAKDEYDYGSNAPGALTRITVHEYGCEPGTHIVDRPTAVIIENSSQLRVAETDYAYDQSPLTASGATDGRDPNYAYDAGITARCNATTVTKYDYTGDISEENTFDDAGNVLTHTDGNGNVTSYAYASSLQAAYLTQTTLPSTTTAGKTVQHSTQMGYDSASGRLTSQTDVQNATTTDYTYNDPLGRTTEIAYPDGGETTYAYTATSLETKRLVRNNGWTDQFAHWDGLGNTDRTLTSNGSTWDTVDTAFDGEQLAWYKSYPYFSSGIGSTKATSNSAEPGDTSTFDALGRVTQVVRSDGGTVTSSYAGVVATTTDEAGKKRDEIFDGLGRMIEVREYTDSSGDHYSTYYGYGLLDDLKSVSQGSETRTYDYDSLNRLVEATNPESGTVNYTYDKNGNLTQMQTANGTTVTYSYDALNRLRTRSYTVSGSTAATPAVRIDYDIDSTGASVTDAAGRMTRVISGASPNATSIGMDQYDAMGRLQTYDTSINGTNYHTSMSFDGIGDPVWEEFPDGREEDISLDDEGRTHSLYDDATGYGFLTERAFNPAGGLTSEDFGNGLVEGVSYNGRLQPTQITVKNPSDQTNATWRMNLAVGYTLNGDQTSDNGNVVRLVDNLGNTGQAYSLYYDGLNRLHQWTDDSGTNCQLSLDEYGNLSLSSGTNCGMLSGMTFNGSNQITGYGYDPSGNLLTDTSGTTYTWDGNSQLVVFSAPGASGSYLYDGLLRRVEKTADSTTTIYARDALGNVAATLTGGTWTDYFYAYNGPVGNHAAATPAAPSVREAAAIGSGVGNLQFFHADQIGTTRAITDENANNLVSCGQNPTYPNGSFLTYTPFGSPLGCTQSATEFLYTGQVLDSESGLDSFQYRQYSPLQARWTVPDPAGINAAGAPAPSEFGLDTNLGGDVAPPLCSACGSSNDQASILDSLPGFGLPLGGVNPANPQTWNPYAYVGNSPGATVDPDGRSGCGWARGINIAAGVAGAVTGFVPLSIAAWYVGGIIYVACFNK